MKRIFKLLTIFLLTLEAKAVLRKYRPKIIGITGSVGKTSTKDVLYTVLSQKLSVRKSEKSFNTEFGVPLTIIGRSTAWGSASGWLANLWAGLGLIFFKHDYPEWLILEMGADHPGDIEQLTKWVPLDIGIVTGMGEVPVHVEFFPNIDAVVREKRFVVSAVKSGGFVLLNTDAPRVAEMEGAAKAKVYSYGFDERTDFRAKDFSIVYENEVPVGVRFSAEHGERALSVELRGTASAGQAYSALAALACAELLGLDSGELVPTLRDHSSTPGRLRLVEGTRGATILDDTYNASPVATELALDTLARIQSSGKKIAVLADMAELGEHSAAAHEKIGRYVLGRAGMLLTFGARAQSIAQSALGAGAPAESVVSFKSREELVEFLKSVMQPTDVVLVKGSQSMRMEKVVEAIMAEPARSKELLVRQDEEWKRR